MTREKAKKMAIIIITVVILISIPIIVYFIQEIRIRAKEAENRGLQEQVNYLESRELEELNEAEEQLSDVENLEGEEGNEEKEAEEVVTDETINEANGKSEGVGRSLQELIDSEDPEDWLKAAAHTEATEEQLKTVANKTAGMNYKDYTNNQDKEMQLKIAKVLLANTATTENVLNELKNSRFDDVQRIGRQTSIEAMVESEVPEDWLEVAKRSEATEEQLKSVASKTAGMNYKNYTNNQDKEMQIKIAETIIANSNTTKRVIEEFKNSRFPEVVEFAEEWLSSH